MIWINEDPDRDKDLAEINRKLAEKSRFHNLSPDPEMGGLSPEQVALLIYTPWQSEQFPVHMRDDLPVESCEQSKLFRNCRTLLTTIRDADGVKITSGGNFTRAFVEQLIDTLDVNREKVEFLRNYKKTINEEDIWDLHLIRIISESAKLIRPYKGKFRVLKKSENLLDERHAGKLYKQLFIGLFTEFNLAYMDGRCPCHAIQRTFPYVLYRLSKLTGNNWRAIENFPSEVLLPAVVAEVEQECADSYSQLPSELLAYRAFRPLIEMALLDGQHEKGPVGFTFLKSIRLAPLFNEFLSFPDLP